MCIKFYLLIPFFLISLFAFLFCLFIPITQIISNDKKKMEAKLKDRRRRGEKEISYNNTKRILINYNKTRGVGKHICSTHLKYTPISVRNQNTIFI